MKITRISRYAWFKIESNGVIIHIDPGYAGYYKSQGFDEKHFEDKADLILITHHHKDHVQPEAIDKIRDNDTRIYATRLCNKLLPESYEIVEPGYADQRRGVKVQVVFAYNTPEGHSTRKPHHRDECVGYMIEIGTKRIYHAGDTDLIPEMSHLGNIDIAFLPIGGTFTMDDGEAIEATKIIKPKLVIPMHTLRADPKGFIAKLNAITGDKCIYLEPGQTYTAE